MAMKARMFKHITESIKSRLQKTKRCEYCRSEFATSEEYLYHMSTHPTEVLPNLYVGDKINAKNIKLINRIGISHVLYVSHPSLSLSNNSNDNFDALHFVSTKKK
eukprot:152345_1